MYEAYPLQWPEGYKRTPNHQRKRSIFKQTMDAAQRFLRQELSRLGAKDLIVSSNIPVRKDGGLYSDYMNRSIPDPGVAIYFKYKKKDVSMCCDQYERVWENVYALGKGIEALRGMERWGVSEFLDRAFTGFTALPENSSAFNQKSIWEILGLAVKPGSIDAVHTAYRKQSKVVHPDVGGTAQAFQELQLAYQTALNSFS